MRVQRCVAIFFKSAKAFVRVKGAPMSSELETQEGLNTDGAIAIIGMAGRFPGSRDVGEFWKNLRDGKEGITFCSEEQLLEAGLSKELIRDPRYVKAQGVLSEPEWFDAAFFGYSPRDAELLDPQQRVFL